MQINEILDEITLKTLNLEKITPADISFLEEQIEKLIVTLKEENKEAEIISLANDLKTILKNGDLNKLNEKLSILQKRLLQKKKGEKDMEKKKVSININLEEEPELYRDFITEAKEHLDSIEVNIVTLEQNPEDKETVNAIFRSFHTIKGVSGFLGLNPINELSHATENMLDGVRRGEIKINSHIIDLILESVDMLKSMIKDVEEQLNSGKPTGKTFPLSRLLDKIKSTGEDIHISKVEEKTSQKGEELKVNFEEDKELYQDFITEAREHLSTIELNIINLEQNPTDLEVINSIFRPFHTIKGVSGFLGLEVINKLSHAAENMFDAARNREFVINEKAIDVILEAVDVLKTMIDDLEKQISTGKPTGKCFPVQVLIKKIEDLVEKMKQEPGPKRIGEILVEKGVVTEETIKEALEKQKTEGAKIGEILIKEKKVPAKEVAKAIREQKTVKTAATIKVDTQKLDNLIDMVGELLITQSMIKQNQALNEIHDQKLVRDLSQLARITTELQKISMSLRMVPIKETFQKMIRLVRDLSKKSGKKVQLIMHGEDTEIDRNMVEELYDPLVHMIRNAIDHGIESPEERRQKGKPETGTIELLAYHKSGNIVIEIKDDGKGLDKEKILKKGIEKGLVIEGEQLSETEIYQLIFKPGFSTAEKITDVSGRGVGLDVVKKTLEKLRGKIEIKSEWGKGTTFIIKLPLTLAIIDGMIVKVGEHRYILPAIAVQEIFRPTRPQYITYAHKVEMINLRDKILPLVRLHRLFNVNPKYNNPWEALVVVVESEDERKCLMVDEVLGKQEVVIKSLGDVLGRIKGIAGGAIMGDGRVGLILDVSGIFELSKTASLS
ncbi:MAG: chemotaxis protein CheA [Candidatus Desulfofervidus auxilii]|nr:chemotaxis protein CheA [Candidatus Desulfofervidus auxilii]